MIGGVTKVVFYWWGFSLYLSSDMVRYIVTGGAAGVGALVSLIPGAGWTVAGAIAGAIGSLYASEQKYNAKIVDYNWAFGIEGIYNQ